MTSGLWAPLPGTYRETRDNLHQVAFFAVSPARQRVVGRMGLRPTVDGFGTPQFEGRVARVEGDLLVHEESGNIATTTISNIREAARFFGGEYREVWFDDFHDPLTPADPDAPLHIDSEVTSLIGAWFAFGFGILGRLGELGGGDGEASEPQIWPEHFDAAAEIGSEDSGSRASYGFSPGDEAHPEPYVYVAPWSAQEGSDDFWSDPAFGGASLGYQELSRAESAEDEVVRFFSRAYELLSK